MSGYMLFVVVDLSIQHYIICESIMTILKIVKII